MDSLLTTIERVATDALTCHPKNARRGDIPLIAESLSENSQYAPLIVQRSTGHVLAGNHTLLAARALEWREIDVTYVDVTDEQGLRIMLSANRTSDAAGYEERLLADLLTGLPDLAGTGYDATTVDDLIAGLEETELPGGIDDDSGLPSGMSQATNIGDKSAAYADTDTRMIILAYPIEDFEAMVNALADLADRYSVDSNAAVVQHLVQQATATK